MGDTFLFARFVPKVKALGGRVVLECPAPLIPLLSTLPGPDDLVRRDDPLPPHDNQAPLPSLPEILRTTMETMPAPVPYLRPDSKLVDRWREELDEGPAFHVGIVWQGDPAYRWDKQRSIPLARFAPLADIEGVRLYALQKGPGCEQITTLDGRFSLVDLGPRLDETTGAFEDTAAVIANLDLVISPDTAVAHLAGALGKPVWLALAKVPHWVWGTEGERTPWYPSMRIFRQRWAGDWTELFDRMATALRREVAAQLRRQSVMIEVPLGELIDKITILEIKQAEINDPARRKNVERELDALLAARDQALPSSPRLDELTAALREVNRTIWDVEEGVRRYEQAGDFGPAFVELARSVYRENDRRAALKRAINTEFGSRLLEEKSHDKAHCDR
jgi:hypothetical protein